MKFADGTLFLDDERHADSADAEIRDEIPVRSAFLKLSKRVLLARSLIRGEIKIVIKGQNRSVPEPRFQKIQNINCAGIHVAVHIDKSDRRWGVCPTNLTQGVAKKSLDGGVAIRRDVVSLANLNELLQG